MWPLLIPAALAGEGVWEPAQRPSREPDMRRLGFDGSATMLARPDAGPLAAVVDLDGCTASFVPDQGLLITNRHCVADYLGQARREGEDLVESGLDARTSADERSAGPDARLRILREQRDVTAELTRGLDGLGDLDSTGGNPGSPTLDARGRLVRLLFDGNAEGIASDFAYDRPMNRSIHCDIRYVLWYLDAVADADALLEELHVRPAW